MNSKELISQITEMSSKKWVNSDLFKVTEEMLEEMAKHFSECESCSKNFDDQNYSEKTLLDFQEKFCSTSGSQLSSWICDKPRKLNGTYQKLITEERKYRYISDQEYEIIKHLRYYDSAPDLKEACLKSARAVISNLDEELPSFQTNPKNAKYQQAMTITNLFYNLENDLLKCQTLEEMKVFILKIHTIFSEFK